MQLRVLGNDVLILIKSVSVRTVRNHYSTLDRAAAEVVAGALKIEVHPGQAASSFSWGYERITLLKRWLYMTTEVAQRPRKTTIMQWKTEAAACAHEKYEDWDNE